MKITKITTREILKVTPEAPRAVPLTDPKQPDTVSSMCGYINRRNPELPYKYRMRREPENGIFWIFAILKSELE